MSQEINQNLENVEEKETESGAVTFLHMILGFYKKNKKSFDRISYLILIVAIVIAIFVNNQKKKQKQVESLSGTFFIKMYENSNEDVFSIGEDIRKNYLGKKGTESVLFVLANKYLGQNKRDKAIKVFEDIVKTYSQKSDLTEYSLSKLAYLYTYNDEHKAVDAFQKLIANYPSSVLWGEWNVELAKLYLHSGDTENAKKICENILDDEKIMEKVKMEARKLITVIKVL